MSDDFLEYYGGVKLTQSLAPVVGFVVVLGLCVLAVLFFDLWASEHATLWIGLAILSAAMLIGCCLLLFKVKDRGGDTGGLARVTGVVAVVAVIFIGLASRYSFNDKRLADGHNVATPSDHQKPATK